MATILFDQPKTRSQLFPLTFTRPVSEIRIGILTISDKWKKSLNTDISWLTEPYLESKYPFKPENDNLYINGCLCPNLDILTEIKTLPTETALFKQNKLLAFRSKKSVSFKQIETFINDLKRKDYSNEVTLIERPWHVFLNNGSQIREDIKFFNHLSEHKLNDPHTRIYHPENIYIEQGAVVKAAILNAEYGPIYLGKNTEIKEGAMIRGPFALCNDSVVNMGAKLIGDNTIGPYCKVGGEISNTVIQGFSNKSHDGFLGNSVIGEWCNIGADTNTSNLKNNYTKVKLWDYTSEKFEDTGLQFCGLIMGDHAKCGINTMFNTGTVVGVGANVFGEGFPSNYIPSFTWGGAKGFSTFKFDKFVDMTKTVMGRRQKDLDKSELAILEAIYLLTAKHRFWETK